MQQRRLVVRVGLVGLVLATLASGCAFVARVSESSSPTSTGASTASGSSDATSVSGDGRFVAFESGAPDLVAGDTNGVTDVFLRDRSVGTVEVVSVTSAEAAGTNGSYSPRVSPDARYVVFTSDASNLVAGDTNGASDIFLRDRQAGTTTRVNLGAGGAQAADGYSEFPALSSDGRFITFVSNATNLVAGDSNGEDDIFVRDRQTGTTTRVDVGAGGAQANGRSFSPTISADGRFVAFMSQATNLVTGDTNGENDVFVRDRTGGTTTRVNVATGGAQATGGFSQEPEISDDGRFVAYVSLAANLVTGDTNGKLDVFVRDRQLATTSRVSVATNGSQSNATSQDPAISADGRYVSFTSAASTLGGEAYGSVFRRDRTAGTTVLLSRSTSGTTGNAYSDISSISADGAVVAFTSAATNLAGPDANGVFDVFARVVASNTTELQSRYLSKQGERGSAYIALSKDGRYAVFASGASDLVPGDTNGRTDIFRRDNLTGETRRVVTGAVQPNGDSRDPQITPDGRFVVFQSDASNLVTGDTNGVSDVFRWDAATGTITCVSVASGTATPANNISRHPDVSDDGRYVSFDSFAKNMVANDNNTGFSNIYLRDVQAATTTRLSVDTGGADPNAGSFESSMSPDARLVVFTSAASDLVSGDTNGFDDVFLKDRNTGITTRVSVTTVGAQATERSGGGAVSDDGRFVSFRSLASNLVANDTNGHYDAFLRDRSLALTYRVDGGIGSAEANGDVDSVDQVDISGDGRYVVFASAASNLVPADTNGAFDVFVYDRVKDRTTRESTTQQLAQTSGASTGAVSADGRYVAFYSSATDIVTPDANGADPDVFVVGNPRPTVTSTSPAGAQRGFSSTITVNGTYFLPGVTAIFGDGITLTGTTIVSEEQVKFTVSVAPTAATGSRTVIVWLAGTGAGALTGAAAPFSLLVS